MKICKLAVVAVFCMLSMASVVEADTRLDLRVAPTSQAVSLDLDSREETYTGRTSIALKVTEKSDRFLFHAEEMDLTSVKLTDAKGNAIAVEVEEIEAGLRQATPAHALGKGEYQLDIEFSKEYNTQAVGLYRIKHEGTGYLFSQMQAVDCRKAFPCWDEPLVKVPYQLTLTVPMQHEAVTNTPVKKKIMGASTKTYEFEATPPMPSYLIAIAAGPLESIAIPGLQVPGRVYTVKGQKHLARLAAEMSPAILQKCIDYFGRDYPYAKLDLIAIPEYWPGAMENVGAVTFADRILLIDSDAASVSQKRTLARVTMHEFAHMWFGDLVTMAWWDDLWLNESFADWMADKLTAELYPEFQIEMGSIRDTNGIMNTDARPSTKQIRKPVESTSDIMEDLGLAYSKGKTLLRMVEMFIGEDAFQRGVRNYINEHAWGNTVAADLFSALSDAADKNLEPILASFLDQPGYPLVAVEPVGGGVKLTQKRFLNSGVDAPDQMWTVPVRLKVSDGANVYSRVVVLDKPSQVVELSSNIDWVMPDEGAHSYYRWSVPTDMFFKMAANPTQTLSERERVSFVGNAKSLLNAGEMSAADYMDVLRRFASEPDAATMSQVLGDLGGMKVALVPDELSEEFSQYVRELLQASKHKWGLTPVEGEAEAVSLFRPQMIAWLGDEGQDDEARDHCERLAREYMTDTKAVDAQLAGVALRTAFVDGDQAMFDTLKNKFLATKVPADRSRFLRALSSFKNEKLQDQALAFALTDDVRVNEMFAVVGGIAATEAGREKMFNWMMDNYDRITSRMPPEFAAYMPYMVSGCSQERLAAAEAFFARPGNSVDGTATNLKKVTDQITDCVNLRDREGQSVEAYLREFSTSMK